MTAPRFRGDTRQRQPAKAPAAPERARRPYRRIPMLDKTPTAKLSQLLETLGKALAAGDAKAAADLFQEDGFWRDLVAFTWNIKTLEGRDQIRAMLERQLSAIQPSGFAVAEGEEATEADGLLEGWIQFETKAGRGYGQIRVRDGKIWTLLTT